MKDKTAIVDGGGQVIGEGIVLRLAGEGADIAVVDINGDTAARVADKVKAMGRRALLISADQTKEDEVEDLARSVEGVLGVHDLRAEYVGPHTIHAGMHIKVRRGLPVEEAGRIAEEVRQRVHQGTDSGYCVIHVNAA